MKFHDYPDSWSAMQKSGMAKKLDIRSREEMYQLLSCQQNPLGFRHMMFDMMWNNDNKPYYDVYPSIIPMLTKLNLDFPGNFISKTNNYIDVMSNKQDTVYEMLSAKKLGNLLIRLPDTDHDLYFDDLNGDRTFIKTIFMSFQPVNRNKGGNEATIGLVVGVDFGEKDATNTIPIHTMNVFPLDERPIEECFTVLPDHPTASEGKQIPNALMVDCIRLCISLCLLEDNPDLIQPDVLAKDRYRALNADKELLQKLIDRAVRKGKRGFTVGKKLEESINKNEISPHTRRPHLFLSWTGKGRTVPKIMMRSGSLVKSKKVKQIPTGYLGK